MEGEVPMVEGDWFRWIVGTILAVFMAFSGWVAHLILRNREEISDIEAELKVLKARPHVDPIEYTKAITEMASAITAMTLAINELRKEVHELGLELHRLKREGVICPKGTTL